MLSFLDLGIYYFLLFSVDGKMVGWNHFLHGDSVEDTGNNYGILTDLTTCEDFYFRTTTSRRKCCRCHEIIFSGLFSILSWLDLAMMKD